MARVMYPKTSFFSQPTSLTRIDQSYYQQSNSDFSLFDGAETPQPKHKSKIDICVGDDDIKVVNQDILRPLVVSNRAIKPNPLSNSVEKIFQNNSLRNSTNYNPAMKNK